jgi:hypothetical protein
MDSSVSAHTRTVPTVAERTIVESFDREFAQLDFRARSLVNATPFERFYEVPDAEGFSSHSIGELILRGAGVVEQTCGGITSNLWDDPFEWTLPETLSTPGLVIEYLDEVEETRKQAFARFLDDSDLVKLIGVPSDVPQPLVNVLLDTLLRAAGYQARVTVILALMAKVRTSEF